jgi:hypothetical protein
MSEDASSRAARMNAKLAEWQRKVAGDSTNAPSRVVELLAANPFITIKGAAAKLDVAFTTGQRAIERLARLGIVKQMGDAKRDRLYCATALLDILEEPAKLRPDRDSGADCSSLKVLTRCVPSLGRRFLCCGHRRRIFSAMPAQ